MAFLATAEVITGAFVFLTPWVGTQPYSFVISLCYISPLLLQGHTFELLHVCTFILLQASSFPVLLAFVTVFGMSLGLFDTADNSLMVYILFHPLVKTLPIL